MARCPDCNKFVSVEQADPESNDPSIEVTGVVDKPEPLSELDKLHNLIKPKPQGKVEEFTLIDEIHLLLLCAECDTELSEATIDVEEELEFTHSSTDCTGDIELDDPVVESSDRYEGKGRYAKHFYGADIEYSVSCPKCGVIQTHNVHVEEQASYFDSLV